jgi:hypothetical protein
MNRFVTAMIMAGLIFSQLPSAIAGDTLGPAQLKNLAPGRYKVTLMGVSNMTVTLRSNGTVFGAAKGAIDSGHWNLSGNKICIAWNKWLGGRARCSGLISEAGYYQGSGFTITPI